jgi:hypothetical protein
MTGAVFEAEGHPHHAAADVGHYNICHVHEVLRTTPGVALGIADRFWTNGDLLDATLALAGLSA